MDESGQIHGLYRAPFSKGIALLTTVYNNGGNQKLVIVTTEGY
jgi:hypothetical protein